jgi:hypothetical protein
MYTNLVQSCSGDTTITLGTGLVTFNSNINVQSITATTIEATTYFSGGTNILDIINPNNTFVTGGTFNSNTDIISLDRNDATTVDITGITNSFTTGGTYNNGTKLITFDRNDGNNYTIDLSTISGATTNTFVSGTTLSGNILTLERNDSVDLTTDLTPIVFSGGVGNCIADLYVTNIYGCSPITIKDNLIVSGATNLQASSFYNLTVSGSNPSEITNVAYVTGYVQTNEIYSTGGTYNSNILTINRNDGGLFNVTITGITDTFVTATTLNSTTLELDRNEGLSTLSVDLLPVLSGKTDLTLFNTYTGNTQIILDTKVENGLNVGGANEIFSGKSGTTLVFNTISGGSNTTITKVGNVQRIDVAAASSENTFVTGGTYNSNTDIITFNNNSGGTFNVTGLADTFTTGGTYNNGTKLITLDRNDGNNYTIDLSTISGATTNTFVSGFTYNDTNTFTISRNNGESDLIATINSVTGLTINGDLIVTDDTNVKGLTGTSALFSANTSPILTLIGSGTTNPIFDVRGSNGELFTVSDTLIGSLFAVNNISGLPVFEVFSDDIINMGSFMAPSLNTTTKTVASAGTTNIYSMPISAYTGAFFDYTLVGNGGARSGNIMSIWSGTTVEFNDVTTNDIGSSTSGATFNVSISGANATLAISAVTGTYTIKTIIRSI